jgi:glyoxylase-like metal-dependent hydrolase (beta-lactamase superfamily II)
MAISWRILSIGNLSMNKFWGETERRREPHSTTVLIEAGEMRIIVDPSWSAEQMLEILDRRRGILASDIDIVFLTHLHGDHRVGLEAFPEAKIVTGQAELDWWRETNPDDGQLDGIAYAEGALPSGLELLSTPGHTFGHTSLAFLSDGKRVVIAGDAVMTREFFEAREPFHNAADPHGAIESIHLIRRKADIVVPGHDNYFLVVK